MRAGLQEAVQAAAIREKRAPSGVDTAHHLFHILDDARARDKLSLEPGEHLVAGAAALLFFIIISALPCFRPVSAVS